MTFAATSVIVKGGKVLSVSRKDNPLDKGFPGGKLEPGEGYYDAMVRETFEETGLVVRSAYLLFSGVDESGHMVHAFQVSGYQGVPESKEEGVVEWLSPEEMITADCSWPRFNRSVFKELGLLTED